ncbi:MAG: PLDc N-terminal domain-containing protein [Verrucomicrobia bacterium]|nr:PLDc N-terminal domain-containing protein [Verrucomicrobiota bacterium]
MEFVAGIGVLLVFLFVSGLGLALTAFWIWMLVSAIQNKGLTDGEKIGWVLAIVFFHFIGSLLYLFIGYPKRHGPLAAS